MRALVLHPESPPAPLERVAASAERTPQGMLLVHYRLEGDLSRLRIPAARPAGIGERLWRHTCCEAFAARAGSAGYHEFNLSPSGQWAAHRFTGYREGEALPDTSLDPRILVQRAARALDLRAAIDLRRLALSGTIRIALSVVAEDEDGRLSYWALRHPPGRPDFHHVEAFALELDEARN